MYSPSPTHTASATFRHSSAIKLGNIPPITTVLPAARHSRAISNARVPCGVKQFTAYRSVPSEKSIFSPALSSTKAISTSGGVRLARIGMPRDGGHVNFPTVKNLLSASILETDSKNFSKRGYTKVTFIFRARFRTRTGAKLFSRAPPIF